MKTVPLQLLDSVGVASPCTVPWESMSGTDRIRRCAQCSLDVHNLSGLTRVEAEAFLHSIADRSRTERICVNFLRRPDGTILTRDCPVGLAAIRARTGRLVRRAAAAITLLLTGGFAVNGGMRAIDPSASPADTRAFSRLAAVLRRSPPVAAVIPPPAPPLVPLRGKVAFTPPTGP